MSGWRVEKAVRCCGRGALFLASISLHALLSSAGAQECAFVTNMDSDTVSVIDTATNIVTRTIRLSLINRCTEAPPRGVLPSGIAITPNGARAYVTTGACFVAVLDTVTSRIADYVVPHGNPFLGGSAAIAPSGNHVYVLGARRNPLTSTLFAIATDTNQVTSTIAAPESARGIAITPDGRLAYVSSEGPFTDRSADTVSVIDVLASAVAATITVGDRPQGVAISPDGKYAYVANRGDASISVIDTATNTMTATIMPAGGSDMAITADGTRIYTTECGAGVCAVDTWTKQLEATIPIDDATSVALTIDGGVAYVTSPASDTVLVVATSTNTVAATIPIPDCGTQRNPSAPCSPTGIALASVPGGCAACVGDCNRDGVVYAPELKDGIHLLFDPGLLERCALLDANADGQVRANEIVAAVSAALGECRPR